MNINAEYFFMFYKITPIILINVSIIKLQVNHFLKFKDGVFNSFVEQDFPFNNNWKYPYFHYPVFIAYKLRNNSKKKCECLSGLKS